MDKRFFCFGTWDDLEIRCLRSCPDRKQCKRHTETEKLFTEIEREIKEGGGIQHVAKKKKERKSLFLNYIHVAALFYI